MKFKGGCQFYRGCQPLFHKHINRVLTYDLLMVTFIKTFHIHFNFHLKEHSLNILSLNCLWYDLIPRKGGLLRHRNPTNR